MNFSSPKFPGFGNLGLFRLPCFSAGGREGAECGQAVFHLLLQSQAGQEHGIFTQIIEPPEPDMPKREIYLLSPKALSPETIAVAFAKTSRAPESFREIAAELNDEKSAKFHEKWVVDRKSVV